MTRVAVIAMLLAASVTVLCVIIAAVSRAWRRHDARLWHSVWTATVTGTMAGALALVVMPAALAPFGVSVAMSLAGAAPGAASVSGSLPTADSAATWLGPAAESVAPVLVAIYLLGTLILGLRLAAGWWRVRRLARLAYPPAPVHLERLLAMRAATSPRRSVEFLVYPRLQTAVTVGWRRPLILLPDRWMRWPLDRLAAVVRHEIAHVARGDFAFNVLAAIAETLLWFVPGVWLATARMRLLAEMAADDQAACVVGHVEYARQLLEAAASLPAGGRARLSPAPGIAADLKRRFDALLTPAGARQAPVGTAGRTAIILTTLWLVLSVVSIVSASSRGASDGDLVPATSHALLHRVVLDAVHSVFSHFTHAGH